MLGVRVYVPVKTYQGTSNALNPTATNIQSTLEQTLLAMISNPGFTPESLFHKYILE